MKTPASRFWAKVDITDTCWNWKAYRNSDGYGTFGFKGTVKLAHRVSLMLCGLTIPKGMVIDHLCRNTGCVRPSHLEVVSNKTNVVRSCAFRKPKTSCRNGHKYSHRNNRGDQVCRTCAVKATKLWRKRNKR